MNMQNDKIRPFLRRDAEGKFEEVWHSYEGDAPLWMFEFMNKYVQDCEARQLKEKKRTCDVMDRYQEVFQKNELETIFSDSHGPRVRIPTNFIRSAIRNIFRKYIKKANEESARKESHDENIHVVAVRDGLYDERDKDFSTVIVQALTKLDEDDRKFFMSYMGTGSKDGVAGKMKLSHTTSQRRFEKMRWAFLGRLGLGEFRHFVSSGMQEVLDALITSGGDIGCAAKIWHTTHKKCHEKFIKMLNGLKQEFDGRNSVIQHCLLFKKGKNDKR
jgi:DNA-directed RNA polymerase specialized sigma24 family protein